MEVCGTGVSIDSLDADATIRDLVGQGIEFRDLEITGAGLEQAFMALTQCVGVTDAVGLTPATAPLEVVVDREIP
jgi:ABC-2 type transport system ATP-binding protein